MTNKDCLLQTQAVASEAPQQFTTIFQLLLKSGEWLEGHFYPEPVLIIYVHVCLSECPEGPERGVLDPVKLGYKRELNSGPLKE